MDKKINITNKTEISDMGNSPFKYAQDIEKNRNYIMCGKVIIETEKTKEEVMEMIERKDWEIITLLIEAVQQWCGKLHCCDK